MRSSKMLLPALVLAMALPLAGCYSRVVERDPAPPPSQVVYVPQQPPEAIAETIPAAPGPVEAYVWEPGHYTWNGATYVWIHGAWGHRERPGEYVAAHWEHRAGGWAYVEGFYR